MSSQLNIKLKADLARLSGPPLESIESISESIPDVKPPKSDIITVHLRIVKIEDAVKRATGEKFGTYVYLIDLDADDESLDTVQKLPYLVVEQKYYFRLTVFKDKFKLGQPMILSLFKHVISKNIEEIVAKPL
ncbi:hypothetical protein AeMF1_017129 [Aphanomyces euteiches]|nr:hypothetical protein AeMF1_017129 [Aphanomyces euteiches]KAH9189453.1 hypothetical protein AeNC1_008570 [Aphanomyces euteiches]